MCSALSRSLSPRSIALVGPADQLATVIVALRAEGYPWLIWPVIEGGAPLAGIGSVRALSDLPGAPDLAYVALRGAPLRAALEELARIGTGIAVCPLLDSAQLARMAPLPLPVVPYGMLSGAARLPLWPGAERLQPVQRGAAVLFSEPDLLPQVLSRRHGLPLSFVLPLDARGGMTVEALAAELLADERVTALAVQADAPGAPDAVRELGRMAHQHGKVVVFWSRGLAKGPAALLRRAGISHVEGAAALVEALWILHVVGPLPANSLAAMGCGPGLAVRAAKVASAQGLRFAPLSPLQQEALARALPPERAAGNPLDCAGLLDEGGPELARVFAEMMSGAAVLSLAVIRNASEVGWTRAGEAAATAREEVGMPVALLAPNRAEMTEIRSRALHAAGVIPLAGLKSSLEALRATIELGSLTPAATPVLMPSPGPEAPVVRTGRVVGALLGIAVRDGGAEREGALRLVLSSDPSFGYLLELSAPDGSCAARLLPLSPRGCRELVGGLSLDGPQEEALVKVIRAVQDHVAASEGAVAGLEIALDLGENGTAEASWIEIRSWQDDEEARRRSPE